MIRIHWKTIAILFICLIFVLVTVYGVYSNEYSNRIDILLSSNDLRSLQTQVFTSPALLDHPITHFHINTSHNTYIEYTQHASIITTNPIRKALQMGARCIELDISSVLSYPIVAHGSKTAISTTFISLEKALNTIARYGFQTSDPLILCLEIFDNSNINMNIQIRDLLIKSFGDKIWNPDVPYISVPIRNLLGKIIIMGNKGTDRVFDAIFDNSMRYVGSSVAATKTSSRFDRVYRDDLNPNIFWANGYNLVAMNFQKYDEGLYENIKHFKNSSFVLQS
jgi:hypothetical protein